MSLSHRNENGFTMLEILVSIAILSITIIPLLGLMANAPLLHAQMEHKTRAAFLAQLKIEEVKNAATYNFAPDRDVPAATSFPDPDSKYEYTVIDDGDADIKDITVQVWYDGEQIIELGNR